MKIRKYLTNILPGRSDTVAYWIQSSAWLWQRLESMRLLNK
jgi:hypothetical protein